MPYISSKDYLIEVAKGLHSDSSIVYKTGRNGAISTALVPIASSALYQTPTAAVGLEIVSSAANDTSAGSGAQKVTVVGLDASFVEQSQEITMNGTTPVAIGTSLIRVYDIYVSEAGTYGTTGVGANTGTITVRVASVGATWGIIDLIGAYGRGEAQIGCYTVPSGKTAYLLNTFVHVDDTKVVDFYCFERAEADDVSTPFSAMRLKAEYKGVSGGRELVPRGPRKFTEKSDIIWLGLVDSGTADAGIDFELLIVDNT